MEFYLLAIIGGFALLVWGANRFVVGAAATAYHLGVSPLIIGLTIVGFGTSAPEILVSAMAAWQGNPGLSIGNAIGSNITNIALVLGVGALITPLDVHSQALRRELPILVGVMFAVLLLILDGVLSRVDGIILLLGLVLILTWITKVNINFRGHDAIADEVEEEIPADLTIRGALGYLAMGLVVLLFSSFLLVWGATEIARTLGVSDLIIGLTIVALGTSLPELATTVVSALKHEHDIAIGTIIGSNLFNLLAVLGMPGLISPGPFEAGLLTRDYPIMIGLTLLFFCMAYKWRGGTPRINRLEGSMLLSAYVGYQTLLYLTARGLLG
ncbi:MAG: calcium/sodium antiporter [Gammaproteobacteria bacterium]